MPTDEDRKMVEALSGYGLTYTNISALVQGGIDEETLSKWYKDELLRGKAKANANVGKNLYQKAISDDTTAAIWWSKTQMGWRGESRVEFDGKIEVITRLPDNL